jgi:putative membrane protein
MEHARRERIALLVSLLAIIILAGYAPEADRLTWLLENMPVFIALPILLFTYRYFPFSRLAYLLMWLQALVLIIGGHFTYAEMPLFNWLRDGFDLDRNYYDRVGHFMQGIAPAIIAREILLRKTPLTNNGWLFVIVCSVTLAFSAGYEFVEWWIALLTGTAADAFLATQGDVWDTQWDMFLAFIGSIISQLLFSRMHDKQLRDIDATLFLRKVHC